MFASIYRCFNHFYVIISARSPRTTPLSTATRFWCVRIPYTRYRSVYMVQYSLIYGNVEMGVINVNGLQKKNVFMGFLLGFSAFYGFGAFLRVVLRDLGVPQAPRC